MIQFLPNIFENTYRRQVLYFFCQQSPWACLYGVRGMVMRRVRNWQAFTVTQAAIAGQIHQTLDVLALSPPPKSPSTV